MSESRRPGHVTCTVEDGVAQARLLVARNTRVAREPAARSLVPEFGPRGR